MPTALDTLGNLYRPAATATAAAVRGGWAGQHHLRHHADLAVKVCALAAASACGLRLAACGLRRSSTPHCCAALRRGAPVSGNPARHRPWFAISRSSTSSGVVVEALLVRCWCASLMVSAEPRAPRSCGRRLAARSLL